jgi:RimJ/RimL family protein N-acetyltransferase
LNKKGYGFVVCKMAINIKNWEAGIMKIRIEHFEDYSRRDIFDVLASWDNDPDIKPFVIPGIHDDYLDDVTGDELMYLAHKNLDKDLYLVFDDEILVGYYTIDTNFEHRLTKEEGTVWISIVIGNKAYWGKGLGRYMMIDLEGRCRQMGYRRIELGVFDYNKRAIALYASMGYEVIGVIENFVFYQGDWRKDIRMLKAL